MKIVFVIDDYLERSNGTVMTAFRFIEELKKRGHIVKIVAINISGENMYGVKERDIPIVSKVASKQNTHFGKPDRALFKEAFKDADIVHFLLPWKLEIVGRKVAEEMGIPTTSAFHCQPENITYNAKMKYLFFIPSLIYYVFKWRFYRHFDNIHCPSKFIADELSKRKYLAKLHIISNGVDHDFIPTLNEKENSEYFNILMIGRFANEKRQDLIIKAIAHSKYKDKIRLTLAGIGPSLKKVKKLSNELIPNQVTFGFYNKKDLIEIIHKCDLYVHPSDVEIEAISCLEALSCGKVPIISDSKKSATSQFAIDNRSLFKAGKYKDLTKKIDYFIEHEEEKSKLEILYAEKGNFYKIDHSILKFEEMLNQAIKDHRIKNVLEKTTEGKTMKKHLKKNNFIIRFLAFIIFYLFVVPILFTFNKLKYHLKIEGKKNLKKIKKSGAIIISNHAHQMDSTMCGVAALPHRLTYTAMKDNFKLPIAGYFVKAFGSIPMPQGKSETPVFFYRLTKKVRSKKWVLFYPEGELADFNKKISDFKRGAFALAVAAQVPILPITITFKETKSKKKRVKLKIGEAIYPDYNKLNLDAQYALLKESKLAMDKMLDEEYN